jgi:hypothetical protein
MESTRVENLPPPPGVISSIKAGFDVIAAHLTGILLPLCLDLFLWLGPRLRMDAWFNSFKADMMAIWKLIGISPSEIQEMLARNETTLSSINLFWILRTIPVGIAGLIIPEADPETPFGSPSILQVNAFTLLGWIALLSLLGWLGGSLYFYLVAKVVAAGEIEISLRWAIVQTVMLSVVWTIFMFVFGFPAQMILLSILQANQVLGLMLVIPLSLISMWVIVPLFFWPHGIFLKRQNFLMSILSSVQLARFTLPTSSMFILTIFLLSVGLNFLWRIPPEASWMTLVGIFGHAFVATALLAASFIYYRDMNKWLQVVFERLKSNAPKQA